VSTAGPDLRPATGRDILPALAAALAGGPPVVPLADDPLQRRQTLAVAQPDQPLEQDVAAVVATSGSTGVPKGVLLSATAIRASAAATHERLGGPGDWALALPAHYVAGLMVLARAVVAGTRVIHVRSDLSDLTAPAAGRAYLSLVPTQLVRALASPAAVAALAGFDAVLIGGAALDSATLDRARGEGIPVVTTYGMSETCGGCVYDGRPLTGVDVQVGPVDEVSIGGPTLFSGYRLRLDLTADVLVDGRLRTSDRGRWHDGRLEILGRRDAVVATGGHKVDLAEVERTAAGLEEDMVIVALPDAEWGSVVVAVTASACSYEELRDFLGLRLPAYALPRRLVRLTALPLTSTGKVDRMAICRQLSAARP
jgi:O-succinylbenzoic acid--CoA ligase